MEIIYNKGKFYIKNYQKEYKFLQDLGILVKKDNSIVRIPFEFAIYLHKTKIGTLPKTVIELLNKEYHPQISFVRKPFPHQELALKRLYKFKSSALLLEMGTAKTKITLDLYKIRKKYNNVKRMLVVCPISCIQVWKNESRKEGLTFFSLRDSKEDPNIAIHYSYDVFAINYEMLKKFISKIKKKTRYKLEPKIHIGKETMLVFDESSKIKNPKAMRTKMALELAKLTPYKHILTGTIVGNDLTEVWSQLSIISDAFNNDYTVYHNFWRFRRQLFMQDFFNRYLIKPKNEIAVDFIESVLTTKAFTYTKKQMKLPPMLYETRSMALTEEQRRAYKQVKNDLLTEFEEGVLEVKNTAIKLMKLAQITSGFVYVDDKVKIFRRGAKEKMLEDLLEEIQSPKIVIWKHFKEDMPIIIETIKRSGRTPVPIYTASDFSQEEFNASKEGVLIANPQSVGYGNTINASIVIFYSNSYSYFDREQAESRTNRAGLNFSCTYIDLIAGSIDQHILELLKSKKSIDDEIKQKGIKKLLEII